MGSKHFAKALVVRYRPLRVKNLTRSPATVPCASMPPRQQSLPARHRLRPDLLPQGLRPHPRLGARDRPARRRPHRRNRANQARDRASRSLAQTRPPVAGKPVTPCRARRSHPIFSQPVRSHIQASIAEERRSRDDHDRARFLDYTTFAIWDKQRRCVNSPGA
jgi:hypothetical protein